jgi:hypothetical protein
MCSASVGHTWTHAPQPLHASGFMLIFNANRSQGIPLGGFLKILKQDLAASGISRSVMVA